MRREGRIHGMVRTYPVLSSPWNTRPNTRNLNVVDSPPTAGLFNKVSAKPTNHSKFTGKCGRSMCRDCHIHPPLGKSKDKSKGSKIRSVSQSGLITGLIGWRVVAENQERSDFKGRSASGMLGYLDQQDYEYESDPDFDRDDVEDDNNNKVDVELVVSSGGVVHEMFNGTINVVDDDQCDDEVGIVLQSVVDEDWLLVEEEADL